MDMEPYIGEIRMFAGNFAPKGWMFCDGRQLEINQYGALFSLIGTTYGWDGKKLFNLPDLRGRAPMHHGTSSASKVGYVLGQAEGLEEVELQIMEMPAHTHQPTASKEWALEFTPENTVWAANLDEYAKNVPADSMMNWKAIGSAGFSKPHNNMMPYLAVGFIICVSDGIYPPRP